VIEREPDLNQLAASMPGPIRELMRRCLTKNPRQRLRDIGEARIALEEYLANPAAAQTTSGAAPRGQTSDEPGRCCGCREGLF